MEIDLRGGRFTRGEAQVLTADAMDEHNTFEEPERLVPRELKVEMGETGCKVVLPPKSVVALHIW